jgi:hypothetical protein
MGRSSGPHACWLRVAVLVVFVVTTVDSASALPAGAASCAPHWRLVSAPNPDPRHSALTALAASSSRDVWAVGSTGDVEVAPTRALVLHWNGRKWSRTATPSLGKRASDLQGIAATGTNDVWAVGSMGAGAKTRPLIEHWDGRRWRVIANLPSVGGESSLSSVASTSADDAWAVGFSFAPDTGSSPLIEHWDGQGWKIAPSADLGEDDGALVGVTALTPGRAWAVGSRHYTPLIEEWDGASWRALPQPDQNADTSLIDVSATSPTDVWAVGYLAAGPLVEHWDGQTVKSGGVPAAQLRLWWDTHGKVDAGFFDVAAIGPGDVWMTGFRIDHWTGSGLAGGPTNGGGSSLAGVSARDIWEAGTVPRKHPGWWKTRILHYSCR